MSLPDIHLDLGCGKFPRNPYDRAKLCGVDPQAYLRHVLRVHAADILAFQPDFSFVGDDPSNLSFIVQRGDETVGVVLLHVEAGTATVLLDYVTPRYRDFSPGRFVWRSSGVLAGRGITRVQTSPKMVGAYYQRLGFTPRPDGSFELAI